MIVPTSLITKIFLIVIQFMETTTGRAFSNSDAMCPSFTALPDTTHWS